MSELLSLIRAGKKPVIGMVQLGALPGSSRYRGAGIDDILLPALAEAQILAENGVDVLMVQNLGDVPTDLHATKAQVAWMTRVSSEVRRTFGKPVGLNLLENDAEAMFAVASAAGADFVRIKIFVGAMLTPFGVESAQAFAAIRARTSWNADHVAIFADVHDRTGMSLVPMSSMTAGWLLSGASSQWKGSRPGKVFEALVDGQYANPVIVVDEIDKASADAQYDPLGALYSLLEHDTAHSFVDEFAEVAIDASQVIWVSTANDERSVPEPILTPRARSWLAETFRPFHEATLAARSTSSWPWAAKVTVLPPVGSPEVSPDRRMSSKL